MVYKCPVCNGQKQKEVISIWDEKTIQYPVKCDYCNGTGNVSKGQLYKKQRSK